MISKNITSNLVFTHACSFLHLMIIATRTECIPHPWWKLFHNLWLASLNIMYFWGTPNSKCCLGKFVCLFFFVWIYLFFISISHSWRYSILFNRSRKTSQSINLNSPPNSLPCFLYHYLFYYFLAQPSHIFSIISLGWWSPLGFIIQILTPLRIFLLILLVFGL